MNHTPEPWENDDIEGYTQNGVILGGKDSEGQGYTVADATESKLLPRGEQIANRDRIVACVNACAGIEDPADWLERLENTIDSLCCVLSEHADRETVNKIMRHFGVPYLREVAGDDE